MYCHNCEYERGESVYCKYCERGITTSLRALEQELIDAKSRIKQLSAKLDESTYWQLSEISKLTRKICNLIIARDGLGLELKNSEEKNKLLEEQLKSVKLDRWCLLKEFSQVYKERDGTIAKIDEVNDKLKECLKITEDAILRYHPYDLQYGSLVISLLNSIIKAAKGV